MKRPNQNNHIDYDSEGGKIGDLVEYSEYQDKYIDHLEAVKPIRDYMDEIFKNVKVSDVVSNPHISLFQKINELNDLGYRLIKITNKKQS